jgi:hypothetical protein
MAIEVYLLSLPLARSRSIVPRRRHDDVFGPSRDLRRPEQRLSGVVENRQELSPSSAPLQRVDPT